MPYLTGTASSLADLVTALRNACVSNGWTLSGNVLWKGTCFAEVLSIAKGAHVDQGFIRLRIGNGKDGSNNLTDTPADFVATTRPAAAAIGPMATTASATVFSDWDWPVTYHIHILSSPDEVFLLVNYGSGQFWQGLSFGQSPAPGCQGTGNWCHGSNPIKDVDTGTNGRLYQENKVVCNPGGSLLSSFNGGNVPGLIPFWQYTKDESGSVPTPSLFHGCYANDGVTASWSHPRYQWNSSANPGTALNVVSSSRVSQPLPTYGPNAWNSEAHLVRIQILAPRLEWKSSIVGEIRHARFVRNDFLDPGQVVTLGTESWKVYPAYRKDAANRDGGGNAGANHSGTCALAVRYDGP